MFKTYSTRLSNLQEGGMSLFEKIILPIGTKPAGGWVKWKHLGIPDEESEEREKARKDAKLQKHCEVCTVLSGDYFPSFNMPLYKQHPHCDCMLLSISKPIAQANSYCDIRKFTEYIFAEKYKGNGKIGLYRDLGFSIEDSEYLKSEFERQAKQKYLKGDYILGRLNFHGQHITITINLKSSKKENIIMETGWMVRPLGHITCNTPVG